MNTEAAKTLIQDVLKAQGIGVKTVWVGRSGSILVTFFSIEAAREAATLFTSFAINLKIADGYDDKPDRSYTKVYRVAGLMSA